MEAAAALGVLDSPWILKGDSELFIGFLSGTAKTGRREFAANVHAVKKLAAQSKAQHHYKWIPRREN